MCTERKLKKMEENKEVKKKRRKGTGMRIAGKIIAAVMAILMVLASCASLIYQFIYNS